MNDFRTFLNWTFFLFSPDEQYREVCQGSHERFLLHQGANKKKKTSKGRFENLSFRRNNEKSDFLVSGVSVNLFEAVYDEGCNL